MKLSVYLVGSNPLPVMIALSYDFKLVQEFDKAKAKNKNPDTVLFVPLVTQRITVTILNSG